MYLNELRWYVESTDSNEIWPEHSLSIEEQDASGIRFILESSHLTAANVIESVNYSLLKLYVSIKRQPIFFQPYLLLCLVLLKCSGLHCFKWFSHGFCNYSTQFCGHKWPVSTHELAKMRETLSATIE